MAEAEAAGGRASAGGSAACSVSMGSSKLLRESEELPHEEAHDVVRCNDVEI